MSAGSWQGPVSSLPESGGGHVLRSQSLPALPDGRRSLLRQPVGRMCGSPRPFAHAVGGCARAVRWERLPWVLEADKAAGWRRASIFLLARRQPCRLCRKHRTEKGRYFWQVPCISRGPASFCREILAGKRDSPAVRGRCGGRSVGKQLLSHFYQSQSLTKNRTICSNRREGRTIIPEIHWSTPANMMEGWLGAKRRRGARGGPPPRS